MHPILSHDIARLRMEELHRQAAIARQQMLVAAGRPRRSWRLALASQALRLAHALDRDGRVVPTSR